MSHICKNYEELREALKRGYTEMSEINLEEAKFGLESDNDALRICEKELTECE